MAVRGDRPQSMLKQSVNDAAAHFGQFWAKSDPCTIDPLLAPCVAPCTGGRMCKGPFLEGPKVQGAEVSCYHFICRQEKAMPCSSSFFFHILSKI